MEMIAREKHLMLLSQELIQGKNKTMNQVKVIHV